MGDSYQMDISTLIASLRALVISRKEPTTVNDILVDYQEIEGEPLQVNSLGFDTVEAFLQASGKFNLQKKNGELYVEPKSEYHTVHIERMVRQQKAPSKKKSQRKHKPPVRVPTPPAPQTIVILSSSEDDKDALDIDWKPPKRLKLLDGYKTSPPPPPIICILSSDEEEEQQQQPQPIPVITKKRFSRPYYRKRYFPRRRPYRSLTPPPPQISNINLLGHSRPKPWDRPSQANALQLLVRLLEPPPAPHISSWPGFRSPYSNGLCGRPFSNLPSTRANFHGNFTEPMQNYNDAEMAITLEVYCMLLNIPPPSYNVYTISHRPGYFCSVFVHEIHYSTNGQSYSTPFSAKIACAQVAVQNIMFVGSRPFSGLF